MSKDKTTTAVVSLDREQAIAMLKESFPVEQSSRIILPRLGMASQDITEGKGKSMKVITEAGTFFVEKQTDEEDENGKKVWEKEELGKSIEGIIIFQRKQLRMYDEATEEYTSSPVYDKDDEIIPIFCNKAEVARGTPEELQAKFTYVKDGKTKSKLEVNRILYVLKDDEVYQMNLRGSSMYSFLTYARKVVPPTVVTEFTSEAKEKGSIEWNQMNFTALRSLNEKELNDVVRRVEEIKEHIANTKKVFAEETQVAKELKDF